MSSRDLHAGFDHAGYYCEDLRGARARFQAMGFTVTPPALFTTQSFATSAIMTGSTYVSISGVVDWADVPAWMHQGMGSGVQAFVLRSHDLDALYAACGPSGTAELQFDGTVQTIARSVRIGDEDREVRFKVLRLKRQSLPGLARCNFCQHLTPQTMWHPSLTRHANGTTGLRMVSAVHEDPAAAQGFYQRLFGRAELDPRGDLIVDCGPTRLRLLSPARLAEVWPDGLAPGYEPGTPLLAGLTFATGDPAQARACLEASGLGFSEGSGGRLVVASRAALGAVVEFVPGDPPRAAGNADQGGQDG